MSQIKYHIFVFLACFCSLIFAQQNNSEDTDMLPLLLQNHIDQAKLKSDRSDYYNAEDHLTKALEIAKKINDQTSLGIIYTKIAKVQFLMYEENKANSSISKAIQIQREIDDYANRAVSYNIKGVFLSNTEEYSKTDRKTRFFS